MQSQCLLQQVLFSGWRSSPQSWKRQFIGPRGDVMSEGQFQPTLHDQDHALRMRNVPWPRSRSQDCFPLSNTSQPGENNRSLGLYRCHLVFPLIICGLYLPLSLQSSDWLESSLGLPLWFPQPLLMTRLLHQLELLVALSSIRDSWVPIDLCGDQQYVPGEIS